MAFAPPPSPPTVIIREATPADALALESLYRQLVDDANLSVSPEQLTRLAESSSSFLLVAEHQGTVCGTALLNLCADAMYKAQPFGVVENVVIAAAHRGQGFGRQLMARIEEMALQQDCTKLMLLSSQARTEAHAFFRSCGFHAGSKHGFVKYRRQFSAGDAARV
ncbi:MAG: N-acetyltransferase family protein [Verrucomicrobium sp.]